MTRRAIAAMLVCGVVLVTCSDDSDEPATPTGTATPGGTGTGTGGLFNECDVPGDCPGQDTECASRTCQGNVCGTENAAAGTPCTVGGAVCDGLGHCVECVENDDCTGAMECRNLQCVGTACNDGFQNGDETDVDCGGSCPACENGESCSVADDCASRFCNAGTCAACTDHPDCAEATDTYCDGSVCVDKLADGTACTEPAECLSGECVDSVCCDSACGTLCEACTATLTSGVDGVCTDIPLGQDPEDECTGDPVCQGDGTCGTCGVATPPVGGTCPTVCTGGCPNDVCIIECNLDSECKNAAVNCPADFACEVQCGGTQSCQGATVTCPAAHACTVDCAGTQACKSAAIQCSTDGPCSLSCSAVSQTCQGATVDCGDNACRASCATSSDLPVLTCGTACACIDCS